MSPLVIEAGMCAAGPEPADEPIFDEGGEEVEETTHPFDFEAGPTCPAGEDEIGTEPEPS